MVLSGYGYIYTRFLGLHVRLLEAEILWIQELCDFISLGLVKFLAMNPGEETEEVKNMGFTLTRSVEQNGSGSISTLQRKSLANDDDDKVLKKLVYDMNESMDRHGLKIQMNTALVRGSCDKSR